MPFQGEPSRGVGGGSPAANNVKEKMIDFFTGIVIKPFRNKGNGAFVGKLKLSC